MADCRGVGEDPCRPWRNTDVSSMRAPVRRVRNRKESGAYLRAIFVLLGSSTTLKTHSSLFCKLVATRRPSGITEMYLGSLYDRR